MTERISRKMMIAIDQLYFTPSERASGVYALIQDIRRHLERIKDPDIPTDWDILCFCVEYIGMQAVALQDEEFKQLVIPLSRWLYSAHYSNPGRIYGEPDRQQEGPIHEAVRQENEDKVQGGNGSGDLPRGVEGYEGNTPPRGDSEQD